MGTAKLAVETWEQAAAQAHMEPHFLRGVTLFEWEPGNKREKLLQANEFIQ